MRLWRNEVKDATDAIEEALKLLPDPDADGWTVIPGALSSTAYVLADGLAVPAQRGRRASVGVSHRRQGSRPVCEGPRQSDQRASGMR
jgi:hypothetical protein